MKHTVLIFVFLSMGFVAHARSAKNHRNRGGMCAVGVNLVDCVTFNEMCANINQRYCVDGPYCRYNWNVAHRWECSWNPRWQGQEVPLSHPRRS